MQSEVLEIDWERRQVVRSGERVRQIKAVASRAISPLPLIP